MLKFIFSKKATMIDEIFTVDLTLCSKSQIDGEDFDNFCGLLRKPKLYHILFKNLSYLVPKRFKDVVMDKKPVRD